MELPFVPGDVLLLLGEPVPLPLIIILFPPTCYLLLFSPLPFNYPRSTPAQVLGVVGGGPAAHRAALPDSCPARCVLALLLVLSLALALATPLP